MVSVLGYGPRNMAMLSSLRSIAIVASLPHDSAISSRPDLLPRARYALYAGEGSTDDFGSDCAHVAMAKWFKVGVAARKDYCTMGTQ